MQIEQRFGLMFNLSSDTVLELTAAPGVFLPTATSDILIRSVKETISCPVKLLDVGCGTGVVGLALQHSGLVRDPLYASDLSETAVDCSRVNFKRYGCSAEVRAGSLLEPWLDQNLMSLLMIFQELLEISLSYLRGLKVFLAIQAKMELTSPSQYYETLQNICVTVECFFPSYRCLMWIRFYGWPESILQSFVESDDRIGLSLLS